MPYGFICSIVNIMYHNTELYKQIFLILRICKLFHSPVCKVDFQYTFYNKITNYCVIWRNFTHTNHTQKLIKGSSTEEMRVIEIYGTLTTIS